MEKSTTSRLNNISEMTAESRGKEAYVYWIYFFFIPSTGLSGQRVCCSTVFALNWRKKGENEKHGETWEKTRETVKGTGVLTGEYLSEKKGTL